VNYVPYLYEYEETLPLLITNNNAINGTESKGNSERRLMINQSSNPAHNKFIYDYLETLSTSKIHSYFLVIIKKILLMELVGIVRPIVSFVTLHNKKA
jgi:hypothetical protein